MELRLASAVAQVIQPRYAGDPRVGGKAEKYHGTKAAVRGEATSDSGSGTDRLLDHGISSTELICRPTNFQRQTQNRGTGRSRRQRCQIE